MHVRLWLLIGTLGWLLGLGGAPALALAGERFSNPPSFVHDIEPLLTRLGCNQGACHGKGAGQNGFRLSLRGYAPELDHAWLLRENASRRVSRVVPEDSLILRKPLGEAPHAGGVLLRRDSPEHRLLLDWIEAGAPGIVADETPLSHLELSPLPPALAVGAVQPLLVAAHYEDGRRRDVTWLAQFATNDAGVAAIDAAGTITVHRAGETAIRAHFQGLVATAIVTVPHARPEPTLDAPANVVDDHVLAKLRALRIPASPVCDDATFIRRVFLDTIGTLPTAAETRRFLDDPRPDKRSRTIDELLARPEWVDYWTLLLSDLLQNRKERDHDVRGTKGVRAFHAWLRGELAANRPWDPLVRSVLTARGSTLEQPAVGYFVVTVGEQRQPEQSEVVASVAQAFLGTRIGCAKCHNHPLERYTQDDYYHFGAFFAKVSLQRQSPLQGPTQLLVASEAQRGVERRIENIEKKLAELRGMPRPDDAAGAEQLDKQIAGQEKQLADAEKEIERVRQLPPTVRQPRTNAQLPPRGLDRVAIDLPALGDPREALVAWMTAPDNEAFQGAIVNRLWKHFLGTGLVEPVDDLRASNPPSNGPLWQALCRALVDAKYDLRTLMRLILNSHTYQRSSATLPENATDVRHYSHYLARRLPAEVMLDAISQATGVPDHFPGYPLGLRATQLPDPGLDSYFLSVFGRSNRTTACACERQGDVTMPQLLHLQNGDPVLQKISSPQGDLTRLLEQEPQDQPAIDALFLSTLAREPSADEVAAIRGALASGSPRGEVFADLLWALLNSKEFAFNH